MSHIIEINQINALVPWGPPQGISTDGDLGQCTHSSGSWILSAKYSRQQSQRSIKRLMVLITPISPVLGKISLATFTEGNAPQSTFQSS